jgi:hypothetical protein
MYPLHISDDGFSATNSTVNPPQMALDFLLPLLAKARNFLSR